jgi:hypothetical protein
MSHHDLYAIGNALVDSEYEVSDALLLKMGVSKRHMTLIDTPRRAELLEHVSQLQPCLLYTSDAADGVEAV